MKNGISEYTEEKNCTGRFLWGVATSAFQLEGSPKADWMEWDRFLNFNDRITDHDQLFRRDLDILEELGVNAYRFSLEWSRIQPDLNRWNEKACRRYRETVDILLSRGISPMITLHHFTHPAWFHRETPWHKPESVDAFLRFAERVLPLFRDVPSWITFNEPFLILIGGYLSGHMPPGKNNPDKAFKAIVNILKAHAQVYDLIHSQCPGPMVSVAHNMAVFEPLRPFFPPDRLLTRKTDEFYNFSLLEAFRTGILDLRFPLKKDHPVELPIRGKIDFIGVNYYTRLYMRFSPLEPFCAEVVSQRNSETRKSDLGWEVHPHGLSTILRKVRRYGFPIIITENGIASGNEEKKACFIADHVNEVKKLVREGTDIRGYFYWSLMDNYEWLYGLDARFGLFKVDFNNYSRTSTEAARFYRHIIAQNRTLSSTQASGPNGMNCRPHRPDEREAGQEDT